MDFNVIRLVTAVVINFYTDIIIGAPCLYFLFIHVPNPFDPALTVLAFKQASRVPPMVALALIAKEFWPLGLAF